MENPSSAHAVRPLFGLIRLTLGMIFLWAFLDKVFGWGFSTVHGKAWVDGVSPTLGFLKFATKGPIAPLYQAIAGNMVVDLLYMGGLLLTGAALIKGVGLRIAGWSGALMMLLFFSAALPPEHHPFLDEHIVYMLLLLAMAASPAAWTWLSLGPTWSRSSFVQRHRWLE